MRQHPEGRTARQPSIRAAGGPARPFPGAVEPGVGAVPHSGTQQGSNRDREVHGEDVLIGPCPPATFVFPLLELAGSPPHLQSG